MPRARLALLTPMARDIVGRSLRLEPPATITLAEDEPRVSSVTLDNLRPSTRYRVILAAGAADIFGQTVAEDATYEFATPAYHPSVRPAFLGSVTATTSPRVLSFEALNVARASLRVNRLAPGQVSEALRARDALRGLLARVTAVPLTFGGAENQRAVASADLAPVIGSGPGVFGWSVDDDGGTVQPLVVTDLDVSGRWSSRGGVVWVSSLSTGAPVAGARIEVRDEGGRARATLETNATGLAELPASLVAEDAGDREPTGERFFLVSKGDDVSLLQGPTVATRAPGRASLLLDQEVTVRGGMLHVQGFVQGFAQGSGGATAVLRARGESTSFGPIRAEMTTLGTFETTLTIPDWAALGDYLLEATDRRGAGWRGRRSACRPTRRRRPSSTSSSAATSTWAASPPCGRSGRATRRAARSPAPRSATASSRNRCASSRPATPRSTSGRPSTAPFAPSRRSS